MVFRVGLANRDTGQLEKIRCHSQTRHGQRTSVIDSLMANVDPAGGLNVGAGCKPQAITLIGGGDLRAFLQGPCGPV